MALDLGVSGLASGFDWRSLVDQLADVERAPEQRLRTEQGILLQRNTAYGNILAQLTTLKSKIDALKDPALFKTRQTSVGDSTFLTASASADAAVGVHTLTSANSPPPARFRARRTSGRSSAQPMTFPGWC